MAEPTADTQFEGFIVEIVRARTHGRLSDAIAQDICAGINDPLPDSPSADDEGDFVKVELIIRLARARGRKTLTAERMQEIVTGLTRVSERPVASDLERPARVSMGPELIYEPAFAEDDGHGEAEESLVNENDVMDVQDGEVATVAREPDTEPPPATDS